MSLSIRTSFALAALTVAALSSAAQQTQTLTFDSARTDWGQDLNFNQFSGSLGTLTGYTLTFNWTGSLSGTVTNLSASSNSVEISHELLFDLTDKAVSNYYVSGYSALSTNYGKNLAVGESDSYSLDGSGSFGVNGLDLSLFSGSGVTDLNLYAYAMTGQDANGPIRTDVDTFAGVSATLTYDYTPSGSTPAVPGPPAFMAMGLGALRMARRRRATRA